MRELLFKAKRIDNGEWVEGLAYSHKFPYKEIDSIHPVGAYFENDITTFSKIHMIDKNTICQYTGLTDKNGNKIWENDLINYDNSMYQCFWDTCNCEFGVKDTLESFGLGYVNLNDAEVIGNIFDNPELLEGGAE